jgi:hypothetical protein
MKQTQKMIVLFAALVALAALVVLVFSPSQSVAATAALQQGPDDCMTCHKQAVQLWDGSHHKTGSVSCIVCHKLAQSDGKHPKDGKYTVENEAATCLVCHTEVAGENIAGQVALSQHGQVGLKCISCHEQHSQGLKLSDGSRTVCENCHKKETKVMLESTHFAAGLSCVNCHMGKERNHTLIVAVATCDECHTDLHESKRMLDAGLAVKVMDTPAAMADVTPAPTAEPAAPVPGGVNMPPWTLVFSGMLIGGVLAWALVGKDPGKPSDNGNSQDE